MIRLPTVATLLCLLSLAATAPAQEINFTKETLDNGLTVIYAPMGTAPVVHVRVLYHVGSRDELPDRQGFAHMFEHMMFRGSAHVPPEQHMKLIGVVGGNSNAFTSFDQTTYVNTVPSNALQMALYLEADRMASFKVNDLIFKTERFVVAEEWRMRYANQPLGPMSQDLLGTMFKTHSYRWTPIGDMDQLRNAKTSELQRFFNTYYVPDNACLVIAGKFDVEQAKEWVHDYFAWIPEAPQPDRRAQPEPKQTAMRKMVVDKPNVTLTNLMIGFKTPPYKDDDHFALGVLADVLASGRTGRLDEALVYSDKPLCVSVGAGDWQLEDPSVFTLSAVVQRGADAAEVQKQMLAVVDKIKTDGVPKAELDKIKTEMRQSVLRGRDQAAEVAGQLAEEQVFGGDAKRVNEFLPKIEAVTPEQVQAAARKYLDQNDMSVLVYENGKGPPPATQAAVAEATAKAPVAPSTQPVPPRVTTFPADFPKQPPISDEVIKATFEKGVAKNVMGVNVITLTDKRLPLVNATLYLRAGSDADPLGREGLADLTASMLRRGSAGKTAQQLSNDLESRGISVEVAAEGDTTRLKIACTKDQLDYAIARAGEVLARPNFDAAEFEKLKEQAIGELEQQLSSPGAVANRDLQQAIYGNTALGRLTTPQSLAGTTLADVKRWYEQTYTTQNAFLIFSGDLTPDEGQAMAAILLGGKQKPGAPPEAQYGPAQATGRQIILVDNPQGRQATVRFATPAYTIESDDKFAGSVAGQILSAGIESRLNKYVRAEKGLTYGCYAFFRPGRHGGTFSGSVDTKPETAAAAIEAMFKVFNDMRTANVRDEELKEAQRRVAGGMILDTETIAEQADRRGEQILNRYPIDYYDKYPERLAEVTAEQVRAVMTEYVKDDQMTIVVVAPAAAVREQLAKLGPVTEVPMPALRGAATQASTQTSQPE